MKFILFIFHMLLPVLLVANIKEQAEKIIFEQYGQTNSEFQKLDIEPDIKKSIEKKSGQKFIKDFVYLWKIQTEGQNLTYAIVDAVRGKSAFITTMAIINGTGAIDRIDILHYNGDRGREVTNIMWLEQFNGKTADDDLQIGSGVDALSGATISAKAIAKGAKRWCFLAEFLAEGESIEDQ